MEKTFRCIWMEFVPYNIDFFMCVKKLSITKHC